MNYKMQLIIVRTLFFLSIILSIISYISNSFGKEELYPFFYWKLYSQPLGSEYYYNDYRIYGVIDNDTIRLANNGYQYLNKDDYYYFISKEANNIKNKKYPLNFQKRRLNDFGKFIDAKFEYYLLIRESFNPIEISIDSTNFRKKIILSSQ